MHPELGFTCIISMKPFLVVWVVVFKSGWENELLNHIIFSRLVLTQSHVNEMTSAVIPFLELTQWGETEEPNVRIAPARKHRSVVLYCNLRICAGAGVLGLSFPLLPTCHVLTWGSAQKTVWSSPGEMCGWSNMLPGNRAWHRGPLGAQEPTWGGAPSGSWGRS